VRDGHILESDVELGGAAGELASDALGDGLSLGDELGGVKLRDDGLEDFVADGRQDSLIVVDTEVLRPLASCPHIVSCVLRPCSPGRSWAEP